MYNYYLKIQIYREVEDEEVWAVLSGTEVPGRQTPRQSPVYDECRLPGPSDFVDAKIVECNI